MQSSEITLTSPADLERHGLREFSRYNTYQAAVSGQVQLALLRKYYEPLDPWRRWVGADSITSRYAWESGATISGYSYDLRPGVDRPHIFLNQSPAIPGLSFSNAIAVAMQNGEFVPSYRPIANDGIHEGIHPLEEFAVSVPEIKRELEHRVSAVLGVKWLSDQPHSPEVKRKVAASLSEYGASRPDELMAEALVDWNEFGYCASPLAIAVGSTIDRYLTRSQGAAEVLQPMTERYDSCFALPLADATKFGRHARAMVGVERQRWVETSAAYWQTVYAGDPPPMPHFEPLDLRSRRPIQLYSPSNPSRWNSIDQNNQLKADQLVDDHFADGGTDAELATVISQASKHNGVIIDRPIGIEPPFEDDIAGFNPYDLAPSFKTATQLLAERSQRAKHAGVAIPANWQLPTPQREFNPSLI